MSRPPSPDSHNSPSHDPGAVHGVYNLTGVPNGRTIVEISKSGYQVWSTIVVINGNWRLNVVLTPTTAPTGSRGST